MLPLLGLAVSIVPELIKLIAGDKAGNIASEVSKAVAATVGTADPVEAKRKIDADPQIASNLQQKLAGIALEATKVQNTEADEKRHSEFEELKASLSDTQDARSILVKLAEKESPVAYGAPIVSIIVAVGFFVILGLAFAFPSSIKENNAAFTLIGTMATAFVTMISFWLGSSQGSRNKDETARQLQLFNSDQTSTLLKQRPSVLDSVGNVPLQARAGIVAPAPGPSKPNRFQSCLQVLLTLEGGYTDDPRDPGGPTNYGITRQDLAEFRHVQISAVTAQDVQNLTLEDVAAIYRSKYWNIMRCDDLLVGVDLMVFHFGVNAGPGISARVLQDCVGTKVDGSVGIETLNAVRRQDAKLLIGNLSEKQLAYYRSLGGWADYSKGWSARVAQANHAALQAASMVA